MSQRGTATEFDYAVIGSGFGGSVSACRLAEKGYSVGVAPDRIGWENCGAWLGTWLGI